MSYDVHVSIRDIGVTNDARAIRESELDTVPVLDRHYTSLGPPMKGSFVAAAIELSCTLLRVIETLDAIDRVGVDGI